MSNKDVDVKSFSRNRRDKKCSPCSSLTRRFPPVGLLGFNWSFGKVEQRSAGTAVTAGSPVTIILSAPLAHIDVEAAVTQNGVFTPICRSILVSLRLKDKKNNMHDAHFDRFKIHIAIIIIIKKNVSIISVAGLLARYGATDCRWQTAPGRRRVSLSVCTVLPQNDLSTTVFFFFFFYLSAERVPSQMCGHNFATGANTPPVP